MKLVIVPERQMHIDYAAFNLSETSSITHHSES